MTEDQEQMPGNTMQVIAAWRRLRERPALATVFDVALLIGVMFVIHAWQTRDLPQGEPAPLRPLFTLDGQTLRNPAVENEVGVIYFFAPWCHVCRASMGNLDDLVREQKVAWAGAIALDYGNTAEVQGFVDDLEITMPVYLGGSQEIASWNIRGYPTYFVINKEGQIDSTSVGYSTGAGLRFRVWWAE